MGAFAERMSEITPLARSAEIEYLKLATGAITATATLGGDRGTHVSRVARAQGLLKRGGRYLADGARLLRCVYCGSKGWPTSERGNFCIQWMHNRPM